ncbi:MAG: serine/threonine protein phosphatase [Candidatus Verstraetearchaeota archaeon]|nr:serine/threonine protein phosphatase [Candidatus Verstraetearchaeota archaeon]
MELPQLSSEEFDALLREVCSLLRRERAEGRCGTLRFEGGLVKLPSSGSLIVIGDLHGDWESFEFILRKSGVGLEEPLSKDLYLLFLGDYVDRGLHSVEVLQAILMLKKHNPGNVALLRGNHEGPKDLPASPKDLPYLVVRKYPKEAPSLLERIQELFDCLHHAALLEGKYFFAHGGVPHKFSSVDEVAKAHELHPAREVLTELLWNDPQEGVGVAYSPRGAGYLFGLDVTERALQILGAKVLIRGHEPCDEGVEVRHKGRVLTLFSRKGPPYFNYRAAFLRLRLEEEPRDAYALASAAVKF